MSAKSKLKLASDLQRLSFLNPHQPVILSSRNSLSLPTLPFPQHRAAPRSHRCHQSLGPSVKFEFRYLVLVSVNVSATLTVPVLAKCLLCESPLPLLSRLGSGLQLSFRSIRHAAIIIHAASPLYNAQNPWYGGDTSIRGIVENSVEGYSGSHRELGPLGTGRGCHGNLYSTGMALGYGDRYECPRSSNSRMYSSAQPSME
ncbi:hypothetical protein SISNIDRAFT_469154 [Sistotremastrum niveocremeum HHB9708]|uniref:Uncharacterized protein n=1 Tax=Sistotremastrum niveocremeum HHB9708 TaxID=1314777 RepID=A0A164QGC5_9AGAM|nr:hypothetical protein SISNIDRAFT_469153 [Sistotremastrum niveocremeum HHB9708]KZS89635.1 hypothetical protein SISNIDRAFT_469154 [Sistotremastrum niveocremeum HHB9708]